MLDSTLYLLFLVSAAAVGELFKKKKRGDDMRALLVFNSRISALDGSDC